MNPSAEAAAGAGTGARILLVEDDAQVAGLVAYMLSVRGHRVRAVASVRDALGSLAEGPPDLVLLDLQLADGHGRVILDHLRADAGTRLVPVIVLSGGGRRDDRLWAIGSGVTDYVPKPFDPEELDLRIRGLVDYKRLTDRLEHSERLLLTLARTIDARDPHTAGHSDRVAHYAVTLARAVGLDEGEVATIETGARYHDVGKIAVPDHVLFKPGRLDDAELALMRRHPAEGWRMLQPVRSLSAALPIVRHHHERLDGSGYPDGLRGDAVPLHARITSVADVFDALTSPRAYREAMPAGRALEILEREAARGWWDASLVRAFAEVTGERPAVPDVA